jgi:hypothetical protein
MIPRKTLESTRVTRYASPVRHPVKTFAEMIRSDLAPGESTTAILGLIDHDRTHAATAKLAAKIAIHAGKHAGRNFFAD